jgi:hypothetical protein
LCDRPRRPWQSFDPPIFVSDSDFVAITRHGALCNAIGSLGPAEFEAVMREQILLYTQSRLSSTSEFWDASEQVVDGPNAGRVFVEHWSHTGQRIVGVPGPNPGRIRADDRFRIEPADQFRFDSQSKWSALDHFDASGSCTAACVNQVHIRRTSGVHLV